METLLFVDHIFHTKTKSFDFLVKILQKRFIVKTVYVDPSARFDPSLLQDEADYVVLAQVDFLTPHFISQGKKVIVFQMFDGSNGLPDEHWALNRQARYINFSQTLHTRAVQLGCESLLVKYAPDPARLPAVTSYDSLRCFFWNRLPDSPINTQSVGRLLKGQIDSCHVHLPRDDAKVGSASVEDDFDCKVTTSNWFDSKAAFDEVLGSCNVFVAPRVAEGIGHAFLDAMARGMVVIAWDYPTHNEYISNWHNGILFNESVGSINLRDRTDLEKMGTLARVAIVNDYEQWQRDGDRINDFIASCPAAEVPQLPRCQDEIVKIIHAYRGGPDTYGAELRKRTLTVSMLSQWRDYARPPKTRTKVERAAVLALVFGKGNAKYFQRTGFSAAEELFTWTADTAATLGFPNTLLPNRIGAMRMQIRVRSLTRNDVEITVNGRSAAKIRTSSAWSTHEFVISPEANTTAGETIVGILCEKLVSPKNKDTRTLGVAIEHITIFSDARYALPAAVPTGFRRTIDRLAGLLPFSGSRDRR